MATPTAADLDPEAGGLIEDARARASERLAARDSRATLLGALAFVAVAVPFAFLAPSDRAVEPGVLVLLVVAYALAARVEFEVGSGFAVPTQIVFVPMLFLLPVASCPCASRSASSSASTVDFARRRVHGERALLEVFSAWHALGPAFVLALAGEPAPDLGRAAALALRSPRSSPSTSPARPSAPGLRFDVPLRAQLRLTAPVYFVDAALAPVGLPLRTSSPTTSRSRSCSSSRCSPSSPSSRASGTAGSTTRSSSATRTAARHSCSATSSRPTTPTPAATVATSSSSSLGVAAELGLDARSQQDAS